MSTNFKKTLAAFVLVAVAAFAVKAPVAKAATMAELQAMIASLQAQLAQLAGGSSSSACYTHTLTLKQGMKGSQVAAMQAVVGAIPDGNFGPQTHAKVATFQSTRGLTVDGIVGPMTGAAMASACAPSTGNTGNTGNTGSTGNITVSGEGTVDDFSIGSADQSDISEGQSGVELISIDIELADDGDLMMDRFDLYMGELNGGTHSSKPWEYFKSVAVLVDGKEVVDMDVDSKSDWTENNAGTLTTTSQEYRLRLSGLKAVLKSDEVSTITVEFDAVSNLDSADEGATWQYGIKEDSFRFLDGTGFMFTDGEDLEDSFTFDEALMAGLDISSSSDDPDASVIEVDDSADTNGVTIGVFEIEEDEGVDVNVTEMTVTLATSDTITDVVKKLYLYDGSNLIGSESVTGTTVTFDNLDLDIDADDTVEITVKADFDDTNDQVRYQNGDTIQVSAVNLTEYEDEFGNDEGDFTETGSFAGNVHTLFADGISVSVVGSPTTEVTSVDGATNDVVQFSWVVDVTAFGDNDVYLNKDVADIVASSTAGDVDTIYSLEYSSGAVLTAVGGTIVCSSSCSNVTNVTGDDTAYGAAYDTETFFKLLKGKTARFTITVSGTNQTNSKQVRALLENIEWTTDEVTSATAMNAETASINSYTVGLGIDAATPFKVIN
jgi:hypothetical protein